jgi:predicted HicB family RNase H-like nuclease
MSVIKSNFNIRIDNSTQEALRELAKQTGQSLNKTAERIIIKGLRAEKEQKD